jgi:hypothetical protein
VPKVSVVCPQEVPEPAEGPCWFPVDSPQPAPVPFWLKRFHIPQGCSIPLSLPGIWPKARGRLIQPPGVAWVCCAPRRGGACPLSCQPQASLSQYSVHQKCVENGHWKWYIISRDYDEEALLWVPSQGGAFSFSASVSRNRVYLADCPYRLSSTWLPSSAGPSNVPNSGLTPCGMCTWEESRRCHYLETGTVHPQVWRLDGPIAAQGCPLGAVREYCLLTASLQYM